MPNCERLIIDIQETIRENGNNEITGPILQDVLVDMVYALCGEQQPFDELAMWSLLGKATPEQINVSHLSATDVAGMLTQAGYKLTDTTYALATDAVAGLVKTGYAASGRNYAVKLDEDGKAYVNVPWTDKFDTYFGVDGDGNIYVKDNRGLWSNSFLSARGSDPEAGSGGGGSGVDMESVWYALAQPTNEKINVSHLSANNVAQLLTAAGYKLTDTTYGLATDTVSGLIKTGYAENGKNYAVKLDGTGAAYVTVNWQDKFDTYFGVDEDGNIYVKDNRGFWSSSFISARGSDPEAGSGGGAGIDMTSVWYALGQPTGEKINVSHIPELSISKITGLQGELDSKLSGITGEMVTEALGYTPYDGSQIGSASVKYAASAGKVAHALSIVAGDVTTVYDGSAEKSVTVPTAEQMALWNKVCGLFDVDADGNVYVTGNRGFYGNSFISARGSDPEAGSGGGSGVDMESVWYALGQPTNEKINASHIPLLQQLSGQITNAQLANPSLSVAGVSVPLGGAVSAEQIASALGLGSNAYTSTAYLPLAGGTMSGTLTFPTATEAYNSLGVRFSGVSSRIGVNAAGGLGLYAQDAIYLRPSWTSGGTLYGLIIRASDLTYNGNPLLHSGNYTNYTVTKTGVGASGTWPISVSGLANRAGYLTSTYTGSGGLQPPSYFNGMGLKVNMMNKPVSYCDVIVVNGYSGIGSDVPYINALAFKKSSAAHGDVWHARGDYGGSSWGTWYKFLDSGNYADYTVTKTGGGASGMWPISVSGSSNTLISTTVTAISNYVRYRQIVGQTSLVGSNAVNGAWCLPTTGGDAQYGNGQILRFGWAQSYYTDLHTGPNEIGSASGLQFRQVIAGAVSKLGWRTLLDTANYAGYLDTRYLQKSSYTASDILAKLKTVDGSGSGLDADLLDGYQATGLSRLLSYINSGTKNTAGWYRIFTSSSDRTNALGVNIMLHLARSFNYEDNEAYTFCISVAYNNQVNITQVSGHANVRLITKIRVVSVPSGAVYVDFYLSRSTNGNTYYITGSGPGTFQEATAVSTPGGNVTEFETVNGCKSSGGFSALGEAGRAIGFDGNTINLCAATGGWAMGIKTVHQDRKTSFDHWVCGAYGKNGDDINYTYYGGTYASPAMVILPNKMVGIGRTDPRYTLDVGGTIRASTGIWSNGYVSAKGQDTTSDARYKRDVAALPAQAALAVLMRLRPATWAWKDDGRRGAGFVAQEVLGVLPEAVREVGDGEDRHLALNYQMLHAYEVCLLQTHETELERLRGRVKQLGNEIKRIRYGS